jgi:hypothetical protein
LPIHLGCPACGAEHNLREEYGGLKIRCKGCQNVMLAVGNQLFPRLNEPHRAEEARYIDSGITGWLMQQYLNYPPLGKRLTSVEDFAD